MKIFLTAVSFVFFIISHTQSYSQDYVVTTKGDTIRGTVKPILLGQNSSVQVKGSDKKKTTYTILQVKSFHFKDETYHPVKGPEGYAFMKLKKEGYLSLYTYQLPTQITYDGYYLFKRDGEGMEVPNLGFKKLMVSFLAECASVADKIDKGELTKRNLDEIIDVYNGCVQNKTIDYDKVISKQEAQGKKINVWDSLEEKLKAHSDFEGKSSALEMITDIKGKIARDEKVPNFLTEGLKNILNPTELKGDLENALKELN